MSHHFIRELVENGVIELKHVSFENQLGNLFSKSLEAIKFEKLRDVVGVRQVWLCNGLIHSSVKKFDFGLDLLSWVSKLLK